LIKLLLLYEVQHLFNSVKYLMKSQGL